jgi:serine/threonine protein kinase
MNMTELIIDQLERQSLFDDRFSNLHCINYDKDPKKREGVLSLVFSAIDTFQCEDVIIKIYDPDRSTDTYRQDCFDRECELLKGLMSKNRCLQLKKELAEYELLIADYPMPIKLKYFVTECLPLSITKVFHNSSNAKHFTILDRLLLFKQIILALRAIHKFEIYHRDLKPDNMRAYLENLKQIVVIIDFGTAVRTNDKKIQSTYYSNVGALGYSSPEALVGISGNYRDMAKFTDFYALGCLFFELFDYDFLYNKIEEVTLKRYYYYIRSLGTNIDYSKGKTLEQYIDLLDKTPFSIQYPSFSTYANIPLSIYAKMDDLLKHLIQFDFRKRLIDFDKILHQIDFCIKIETNDEKYRKYIERKRIWRQNRGIKDKEHTFQNEAD